MTNLEFTNILQKNGFHLEYQNDISYENMSLFIVYNKEFNEIQTASSKFIVAQVISFYFPKEEYNGEYMITRLKFYEELPYYIFNGKVYTNILKKKHSTHLVNLKEINEDFITNILVSYQKIIKEFLNELKKDKIDTDFKG